MKNPSCPKCNSSNVAVIFYGYPLPSEELSKSLDSDQIILGGCCITDDDPKWECNSCSYRWGKRDE